MSATCASVRTRSVYGGMTCRGVLSCTMNAGNGIGSSSFGPAAPPCPAKPWHWKQPTVSNSFFPFAALPAGAFCASAADKPTTPERTPAPSIQTNLLTVPPSTRLRHDVDERGLAALHNFERAGDRRTQIGRVVDRPLRIDAHRFRERREVDVRVVERRADMSALDAALIALRDALQ